MTFMYLVRAQCPDCDEVVSFVEEREYPVGQMQDVEVTANHCPECGVPANCWDIHEEAYIERGESDGL